MEDVPRIRGQPKVQKTSHPIRLITCSRKHHTIFIVQVLFSWTRELRKMINNIGANN